MRISTVLGRIARDMWLNSIAGSAILPVPLRAVALRRAGLRVGHSVSVAPLQTFAHGRGVSFGDGTYVNYGCFFDANASITLGRNVRIGPQVSFITSSHDVTTQSRGRAGAITRRPIVVGDGAWIGARTVVQPGVTVGAGSIVAAGSVVTADCEPNSLYAGVPAVFKKTLPTTPVVQKRR